MTGKLKSIALALATTLAAAAPALAQQIGTATAVNPSTEGTPPGGSTTTLTVGARVLHKERIHTSSTGSVQLLFLDKSTLSIAPNIFSQGPNGLQALNLKGYQSIQNGVSTTSTITNYMVKVLNWTTPAGPPFFIPPDLVLQNITILSSVNGQTGGGPPLHGLPTIGFACGTNSTPPCSWSPTNTGENDALQIIIESTKLATQPNPPPPPPPPTDFSQVR